jgi:hypothetical protein
MTAADDLRERLEVARARAGALLTAGELQVVTACLALPPPALGDWARLLGRAHDTYPVDPEAPLALDALHEAELIDGLVPWPTRARRATADALRAGCRRLGLPVGGDRAALGARLADRSGWDDRPWFRIRHRRLFLRLDRWATLRKHPDPAEAVVARLGHTRWPRYDLTPGPGLWPTRAAALRWEALLESHSTADADTLLTALAQGIARAPGRLDLTRRVTEALELQLAALLRRGETAAARAGWQRLVALGTPTHAVAARIARTLEREGRPTEALALLRDARPDPRQAPESALEIAAAGRRLARLTRQSWPPDPPLRAPPERVWRLPPGRALGPRPGWTVGGRDRTVEDALVARLAELGRNAQHVEGAWWTTLFALLFAETYFLPVPGALPVPRLPGPLDLGRPGFDRPRADAVAAILADVRAGGAAARLTRADPQWRGIRLAGADWTIPPDLLVGVANALPPAALAVALEALLADGWRAARGLPDLVVLPGPGVRAPEAFPGLLPAGALLVEVKGPTDALRAAQRAWADRLLAAGAPVEWWYVGGDQAP